MPQGPKPSAGRKDFPPAPAAPGRGTTFQKIDKKLNAFITSRGVDARIACLRRFRQIGLIWAGLGPDSNPSQQNSG
jgi:hypothetical protein